MMDTIHNCLVRRGMVGLDAKGKRRASSRYVILMSCYSRRVCDLDVLVTRGAHKHRHVVVGRHHNKPTNPLLTGEEQHTEGSLDGHHITGVYDEYDVSNKYPKSLCI
jgi:hypothetical protein